MDTAELNKVPKDQESIVSGDSPLGKSTNLGKSRLDSEKSYADIVNSDHVRSMAQNPSQ